MGVSVKPSRISFGAHPLLKLYTVLAFSSVYFCGQLYVAYISKSLTLQADAYYMLCNILFLITAIVRTQMCRKGRDVRNTFGWTRIDVCGAVGGFCFLAALFFSTSVETIQTFAGERKTIKCACSVGLTGLIGVGVNIATLIIIRGYSYHQQWFRKAYRPLSETSKNEGKCTGRNVLSITQGIIRDFLGSILVIAVAVVTIQWEDDKYVSDNYMGFVDPTAAVIQILIIACLSYSYARDAGYILLLTIPGDIDVKMFANELHENFPQIYDIHEFHIWQLTPTRIVASAHLVLHNSESSWSVQQSVASYLKSKGVTHVTLQPEFIELVQNVSSVLNIPRGQCFLPCNRSQDKCHEKKCCGLNDSSSSLFSIVGPPPTTPIESGIHRTRSLPSNISQTNLVETNATLLPAKLKSKFPEGIP